MFTSLHNYLQILEFMKRAGADNILCCHPWQYAIQFVVHTWSLEEVICELLCNELISFLCWLLT